MQMYDLLMIAVLGLSVLFGLWKGFAWQVASLASIFVSYFVARNFSGVVAGMIGGDPSWNRFLAMFILFFGSSMIIWIAFGFIKSSIERMHLKTFDRQVGAVLGAIKGGVLCIIITLFSVSLLGESVCKTICTSRSGNYVVQALDQLHGVVPDEIRNYIGPYVVRLKNEMDDHKDDVPGPEQPGVQDPGDGFNINWPANSSPNTQPNTQPNAQPGGWAPPASPDMTWTQPGNRGFGQIERADGSLNPSQQIWEGAVQQIDWGQAAGQALDGILNGRR